ncbi:hypothetical protein BLS_006902 [Venturia inaequalis]|uniref:Uncharacterized protein n=1 Tax=Venturia inaequalis TaxID=5025 RepID=A0A8H3Z6X7_VENIN|nr:hypothetical protein BLS_006902 [Venturia inaequalis]KAE9994766.1 hypothetical protein EG327_003030 [Venturia inaequalis]RDI76337.1 Vacuolar import and degradation protein 27 [Venturia inaequalis]
MKLSTTLLLCLTVNSVTAFAKWKCNKETGTPGVCKLYTNNIGYGTGKPPQGCRKASPCVTPDHPCTPNKFTEAGGAKYANCNE